jgi:ferredoxin
MLAYFGFKDGSGDWFIIVDTDKCDGCGKCVEACPSNVFQVGADEYDPLSDKEVASVVERERKKIRYTCAPCKPGYGEKPPPCVAACQPEAISHSSGWKLLYGER